MSKRQRIYTDDKGNRVRKDGSAIQKYGSGGLVEVAPGKWEANYYDKAGKRHWRTIHAKGKKAAQTELNKYLGKVEDGSHRGHDKITVSEGFENWFRAQELAGNHARSIETAREKSMRIVAELGDVRLQDLDKEMVAAFFAKLQRQGWRPPVRRKDGKAPLPRAYNPSTLEKIKGALVTMLRQNRAKLAPGVLEDVRDIKLPRVASAKKRIQSKTLSLDQRSALLSALEDGPWYSIARLLADTGLRRGEVLALQWRAIDLEAGELRVERVASQVARQVTIEERAKNESSLRTVALFPDTVEFLRALWREQAQIQLKLGRHITADALLFPHSPIQPQEPWSPDQVSSEFGKACANAGFKGYGLHSLRHTYAGRALEAGAPVNAVASQLGHKSVKMTLDVYGKASPEGQREAARLMGEAIKGKAGK